MADEPTRNLTLLAFAGSLRRASYNRALLRAAQELTPAGMKIDIFDIGDIPLYNEDVEAEGDPEAVARFKEAIRDADGLLIATPEYNHGVPGVTKNAIDWASRPPRHSPLDGKPVAILGASPGITGSARGQSQLRQAFEFTNSYCMPQPEILVYQAHQKFDEGGKLTDAKTREFLGRFLVAVGEWVRRFQPTSG
ncbi:MAG TPA: NADPH-dependent FMN reductase [Thermoanaerobaculia bacterium]|nr:NADPH-dependent FMN reductase [Thermoanaerobaculia bacterium]